MRNNANERLKHESQMRNKANKGEITRKSKAKKRESQRRKTQKSNAK